MADEEVKAPEPQWLKLQKKIFGRYIEQRLRQVGITVKITDVVEDLKDGLLLIDLVEALSGKKFSDKKPKPSKVRIQQIDNVDKALKFVKECGIKSKASNEDVVDGNANFVMGLVFSIIIKYMKLDEDDAESTDVKEALMLWLKNKTTGYKDIQIDNFTKSFHDGLVFCALIHKMRPKLVPYDSLNKADKLKNLELALDVAEKYCNVERYLEPEDISHLDEFAMVIYLYDWYYGVSLLQKQDVAARRIGKLADMTKLHDEMRAEYNNGAQNMDSWLSGKIAELGDRSIDNTMAGIKSKIQNFNDYKSKEKADKFVANMDLVALFDDLALRLHNNNRPAFKPPQDPKYMEEKFNKLDVAEGEYSVFLYKELDRQIKLDQLAKRFKRDLETLDNWLNLQMSYVQKEEPIDSVDSAQYALDNHAVFDQELISMEGTRVASLKAMVAELAKESYEFISEIKSFESSCIEKLNGVKTGGSSKHTALQKSLEEQKTINDNLCKDFDAAVKAFDSSINDKQSILSDKSSDLETLLQHVTNAISNASEMDALVNAIEEVDGKIQARQITVNPYTTITLQDCKAKAYQFKLSLNRKKQLLEAEIENSKRSGLSEEQVKEVSDNFNYFDKDGSGFLERRELRSCLQSLGEEATPAEVKTILDTYDKNGDGKIAKTEFMDFMVKRLGDTNTKEEILTGFGLLCLEKANIGAHHLEAVVNDLTFKDHHVSYLKQEMTKVGDEYDYNTWTEAAFAR